MGNDNNNDETDDREKLVGEDSAMSNTMTGDAKIVFARPWRGKRVIGPHVVRPVHDPVRIRDSIHGVHERVTYQWACKYCDESNAHLASFLTIPSDCGGIEWLDDEVLQLHDEFNHGIES